jgi:hypothetical protein
LGKKNNVFLLCRDFDLHDHDVHDVHDHPIKRCC